MSWLALYFMHYNFCRIHQSLRVTPAMEAGIADHVWSRLSFVYRDEPLPPPRSESHSNNLNGIIACAQGPGRDRSNGLAARI